MVQTIYRKRQVRKLYGDAPLSTFNDWVKQDVFRSPTFNLVRKHRVGPKV